MAAENGVKVPKGRDRTQTERKVSHIHMVEAACGRTKIECSAGEYTIDEVASEVGVHFEEGAEVANVVGV